METVHAFNVVSGVQGRERKVANLEPRALALTAAIGGEMRMDGVALMVVSCILRRSCFPFPEGGVGQELRELFLL